MLNPGPYFRRKLPGLYFPAVFLINIVKNAFRPYSIYITDSLGGSFKEYFINSDMPTKLEQLKRNLDKESVETIDVIMKRLINYPDEKYKLKVPKRNEIAGGLLPVESDPTRKKIKKKLKTIKRELSFPAKHIEESVFYYCHGLILLPDAVSEYIKDGDFVDAGAFIGDSAIALREYQYGKIFSVEMSEKSISRYKVNMSRCNIESNKYEIIHAGIVADDNLTPFEFHDTGSPGLSIIRKRGKYDPSEVVQKSVDTIVKEYKISPRFIKADVEGNGLELVKGSKETLTSFRPVISIAIYHNPFEFFEIKPLLEELLTDYIFHVRKLTSGVKYNQCHSEIILLGYPGEIGVKQDD